MTGPIPPTGGTTVDPTATEVSWADLISGSKAATEPVPDGQYLAKVISTNAKMSSTGKPMLTVRFEIIDGPHAGRKVTTNLVVSAEEPVALAIFFRHMTHLGITQEVFFSLPPGLNGLAQAGEMIISRQATLVLGNKTWQGVARNEINNILPVLPGSGPVAPGTVTGPALPGVPSVPSGPPTPASTPPAPAGPPSPTTSSPTPPPQVPF